MKSVSSRRSNQDSISRIFANENIELNIVTPNPYKCSGKMSEDCWSFDFSEKLSKSTILSMNSQSHMAYLRTGPYNYHENRGFNRFISVQISVLLSEHLLHKIESCNEVCLNKCSCDCSIQTVTPCENPPVEKPCGPKGSPGIKGPAGSDGSKGCTGFKELWFYASKYIIIYEIWYLSSLARLWSASIIRTHYFNRTPKRGWLLMHGYLYLSHIYVKITKNYTKRSEFGPRVIFNFKYFYDYRYHW